MNNRPDCRRDKNHINENQTLAGYDPNWNRVGGGIGFPGPNVNKCFA